MKILQNLSENENELKWRGNTALTDTLIFNDIYLVKALLLALTWQIFVVA